jgi:hypothetical protein
MLWKFIKWQVPTVISTAGRWIRVIFRRTGTSRLLVRIIAIIWIFGVLVNVGIVWARL